VQVQAAVAGFEHALGDEVEHVGLCVPEIQFRRSQPGLT
jgi:hypothetical protein